MDVLADEIERQGGVNGVAERVEDRGDVVGDVIGDHAGVGRRDDDVLGEPTVSLDTDADDVATVVELAGPAVAASPADDMAFAGNPVADLDAPHVGGDGIDDTDELVANSDARRDVGCGQSSQASMWRSVPQMAARLTRIRTSPGPGSGTGRSRSSSPGPTPGFTKGLHDTTPNS